MKKTFAAVLLLIFPAAVLGHHSRAEFANASIEVEGVLTEVIWKNPHVALFLDVAAENGRVENWRIEGSTNPMGLMQSGVEADLFTIGERLRVVGSPSKFREALLVNNILLANGTEVIMNPSVAAYWDGPYVGGNSQPPKEYAIDTANLGFFRVWHPVGNPMMKLNRFDYTEEALDARLSWDLVDNPIVRCEQPGMPVPIFHPQPLLFTEEGENIIGLRHGYFDTQRTIYMDATLDPEDQPQSHLGFSQGRWEDENTLVIETTRINYPYFDFSGTSQSEDIKVIERYSLSEDMTQLNFEVDIDDPLALAQTASTDWQFMALDKPFSAYECNVF
jgi:hypothetical protein